MQTPPRDWSGGDPDDLTAWTVIRAQHAVTRIFSSVLREHELTPQQFGVLIELVRHPGLSQAALARRVLATAQSVGDLVRGMAERGLLARASPPGPGRAIRLRITDDGRRALDRATPAVLHAVRPQALGLSQGEDAQLNALLHTVIRTVD
ncbi:MarR family winged helix-turn-helix transcriptional regulator [Quadrisphaera sp. DSM 44207]|uniref:MarR family winged helix-turn-helix transcriptional regulator n=1 Tax=Quadrisphaera sp. DSM 44207 TaxID=1881057 RepID=UPI00088369C5|nr:MarR family transcriptional regulator [Quadrisphaera sp. DSM 44207]SDQ42187.1 DNA-binding transcriptional regulator, MarR family [Quadrisphaera sp. DSM 44207]